MINIVRRKLMGAVGVTTALGLSGLPTGVFARVANPAGRIKITQAVISLAYMQSFIAQQQGYFAQEGLEAELISTGGGGPDVQIVLSGRAAFTVSDGAQVLPAVQQGQSLVCVLALLNRSIINVTMRKQVADELGITPDTSVADRVRMMKGLRVGVTQPGALTWQMARYNAISHGLDPDSDLQIVGMGDAPSLAAALRRGNLDVIYISVPIGETLVSQGVGITLLDNSNGEDPSLPSFLMEGLWTTPNFLNANREVVQQTVNAYRKASRYAVTASAEELADTLAPAFSGFDRDVLVEGCRKVQQAVSRDGVVDARMLDVTQEVLEINGVLRRRFALAELYDDTFLV